jgi:hypothetical protein
LSPAQGAAPAMRLEQCARSATVFVMITERRSLPRFFAAAPDALTAGLYLLAWIAPATLGPDKVKALLLGMFIEFLVMHSSIAFEGIDGDPKSARATRLWRLAGLTLFYGLFIAGFAWAFDNFWPVLAFAWLFVCRFFHLLAYPTGSEPAPTSFWVATLGTLFVAMAIAVLLPLPSLGLTREFVHSMKLSGSGDLVEHPETLIAFGLIYFSLQAWLKVAMVPREDARDS